MGSPSATGIGKDGLRLSRLTGVLALSGDRAVGRGLRVLGHSIREQPGLFAVGVGGSIVFGLLTIAGAAVVGAVVGRVVVPAIDSGHTTTAALAGGAAAIF